MADELPKAGTGPATPLSHRPFAFYFWGRLFSEFAYQIATVAMGWQIYALTGRAFYLGLAGLMQFLPTALLVLVAGHAADRYDRKRVLQVCLVVEGLMAGWLAWGNFAGGLSIWELFGALVVFGTALAFESPAALALIPNVAPEGMLQKATALATSAGYFATIGGPALGGLLYAMAPGVPYTAMALFWLVGSVLTGGIVLMRRPAMQEAATLSSLFAGVRFVFKSPPILGTISLDLFAVLLGGATALLPIYAKDILHTGPWGLGALRGAPAVGALLMTFVLARHAIRRRAGIRMFQAVIVFGVATVLFALSHSLWLSLGALTVMGAADTVSVVIRLSLVQLATPDDMRGRVGAVNSLFVGASNQLGEFESGMTAALLGAMPAAVLGGIGTILIALLWMKIFPVLRQVDRLE